METGDESNGRHDMGRIGERTPFGVASTRVGATAERHTRGFIAAGEEPAEIAFQRFFEAEYRRLFQTLYLVSGSREDGEDLAQEAMARAFEHWDVVRRATSPTAYVYRIALNLFRRRHRRRGYVLAPIWDYVTTSHQQSDPAAQVVTRDELRASLLRLSIKHREAIVLVDWLGLSTEEAARILSAKPGAIRVRLHRARSQLKDDIGSGND